MITNAARNLGKATLHERKRSKEERRNAALTSGASTHANDIIGKSKHISKKRRVKDNPSPAFNDALSISTGKESEGQATWSSITSLPLAADATSEVCGVLDYTGIRMKSDHVNRPLLVCPDGHVYCEMLNNMSKMAVDLLVTVAEPISRPQNIHEYQITVFSTYAAVSVGIGVDEIICNLNKFSKNEIPGSLIRLLRAHGAAFGRVKLVLKDNSYFIEAVTKQDLDYMLSSAVINEARIRNSMSIREVKGTVAKPIFQLPQSFTEPKALDDTPSISGFIKLASAATAAPVITTISQTEAQPLEAPSALSSEKSSDTSSAIEDDSSSKLQAAIFESKTAVADIAPEISVSDKHPEDADVKPAAEKPSDATDAATLDTKQHQSHNQTTQAEKPQSNPKPEITRAFVYSFEVHADKVGRVKEAALTELKRPLLSEYDCRRDTKNPAIEIALRPITKIRYYQERSMGKMFSNGRARSGIIVLPCGAGKTLTGIIASTTIRKSTMVLTSSAVAVDQWRRAYFEFTTINPTLVISLTSDNKRDLPPGGAVLITTYTMLSFSGKRSEDAERIIRQIRSREWGLLIYDEVQFAPAPAFRKINDIVKSHCKLGLTATLVREDDLIHDLQWLIGPKLYEANWLELQEAGYLAKVQCSEVWCPMVSEYFKYYISSSHAKQRKLWVCNPNKLRVCEYLLRFHEARMDKVIVFSDNLFALREVAKALHRPYICGEVSIQERMLIINKFKSNPNFNSIFLSKVGDNAIDIPCANVVIQISFNFASRRQEAQRLGRILRPKPKDGEEFNAFFYSVVSKDTQEMLFADKRQQFITDQGYAYKVLPMSVFSMENENLIYDDPIKQRDMLAKILASDDKFWDLEEDDVLLNDSAVDASKLRSSGSNEEQSDDRSTKRNVVNLSELSGGGGSSYRENPTRNSAPAKKPDYSQMHPLFRAYHKTKK